MTSTRSSKLSTDIEPIRTLLATAVDHAGLFPPAGLNMSAAVAAFDSYRQGRHAWMLGSFVVPAERLDELAAEVAALDRFDEPWPVSILVASAEQGARAVEDVAARLGLLHPTAVEVRPQTAAAIRDGGGADSALGGVSVFHEVPLDAALEERLDAVARVGALAKVRTGGVTRDAIPEGRAVVRFLRACSVRGLALKATAGLHHAFAGTYPLTYEPGSACAPMHGFVGLSLVAALIHAGSVDEDEAVTLLDAGPDALDVRERDVRWGTHRLTTAGIADARARFFRSFGSCSFTEPVQELSAAGLIPA